MSYLETNVSLMILRCDAYLRQNGFEETLTDYPQLLDAVAGDDKEALKEWALQEKSGPKYTDEQAARYFYLLDLLGEGSVIRSVVDLALASFYYAEFDEYLMKYFGSRVCLKLAFLLEGQKFPDEREVMGYTYPLVTIFKLSMLGAPVLFQEIKMDDRIVSFLSGSDLPIGRIDTYCELFQHDDSLHDAYINQKLIDKGAAFLGNGGKALQLSGAGGRRFIAKHIAKRIETDFVFIDLMDITGKGIEHFEHIKNELVREALFQSAGICIYGITDGITGNDNEYKLEILERDILLNIIKWGIPLIICSDTKRPLITRLENKECLILELPETISFDERKKVWEGFSVLYGLDIDPNEAAMRYRLSASEVMNMIRGLGSIEMTDVKDKNTALSKLSLSTTGLAKSLELGRIIYSGTLLDDVKLKPELKCIIENIIDSAKVDYRVFDEWGLKDNYRYGCAVSALLCGPPGTGKTMSANAIAGELGIPLYQVNLSNVVDKYVGETEKNLERVFAFAEKANVVLFFDEADSLFGKRSEVKDSQDKYANNEISYLLQRIEAYSGIVVMATNIKGNIDPAFMRRIRYVAHFDNPDSEMRRQIWESLITDRIPHEDIDVEYLAEQFDDFTGSIIKTVFLNACSLAAASGEKLAMKHLLRTIKMELSKGNSFSFTIDTLGKYSHLI
ncbi:MAG: ATP-binding protein [Butyrivibrio sp.]|nr:ATP-binding protein [Butyrivibrio sp.]